MIFAFWLFLSLQAWAKDPACTQVEIKIPANLRVAVVPNAAPVPREFSYEIEFCAHEDRVYLLEHGMSSSTPRQLVFSGAFIEKIYQPKNVKSEVFKDVPVRTEVIRRGEYAMSAAEMHLGEFRFYANDRLQALSLRRTRVSEWAKSPSLREFGPFRMQRLSAPVPENAGVDLVWNHFSISDHGPGYTLWSLRTVGGFEMTYLLEVETGIAVPLVEAYLATPEGKVRLDEPTLESNKFDFGELGRVVQLEHMELEKTLPAISYEKWQQIQEERARAREARFRAARSGNRALNVREAHFRKHLLETEDPGMQMREWIALLEDENLRDLFVDLGHAQKLARALTSEILLREFPELVHLSKTNGAVLESLEAFGEASADLLLGQVLKSDDVLSVIERHLEALPETPVDEASCQELLRTRAESSRREINYEISRNLQKASLNLDVLRINLEKLRGN